MISCDGCGNEIPRAHDGELAIIGSLTPMQFAPGHPMQGIRCIGCRCAVGDSTVLVVGVAALGGEACRNGCIVSNAFLVHGRCLPVEATDFPALIYPALACQQDHPWG